MDMSQYMEIFLEESKEHLQHMNQVLLDLENNKEDLTLLNEIFRIAHTIKGMAGTMGFSKVANLTHEMENVMHLVRNQEVGVNDYIIDILFECFDALEDILGTIEDSGQEGDTDPTSLINKLAEIIRTKSNEPFAGAGTIAQTSDTEEPIEVSDAKEESSKVDGFSIEVEGTVEGVLKKALGQDFHGHKIKVVLNSSCMLKAARAFIVFNTLEQAGEVILSYPSAEEIEDENFEQEFELIYVTKNEIGEIEKSLMNISEIEAVYTEEILFDNLEDEGEVEVEELTEEVENVIEQMVEAQGTQDKKESKSTDKSKAKSKAKGKTSKTVRVDIDRLDNLMNLVSELIIIKTRMEDYDGTADSKTNMDDAVEYLERITTNLHDAVMKVRMVPVERTFNRFPRMVRDLAKDLGKTINLNMSGEETEVDRTVIDEIGDPLIHLIRNSIDHGIESPDDRELSGKPSAGSVDLRAYPDGNTVVIEVEDDGAGIDSARVGAKALSKGLTTQSELDVMNDRDVINFLFKPGFSTADVVTDLSGRGVGLDVVKTKIETLGGTVEVQSNKGQGSKFLIRLPLTLAIIQALMVFLGEERYALPLNNIKEITTIAAKDISLVQHQEVVLYRNKTLPILRLKDILEVPHEKGAEESLTVVIVRKGDMEAGLVVDSLIGQQEIVIKSLGKYLTGIKAIQGATILGNGGVALIVDPNQLF